MIPVYEEMMGNRIYLTLKISILLLAFVVLLPTRIHAQETPDIPDLIRVTVDHSDNGVLIEWEASADNDIRSYHIWRREPDLSFSMIDSVDAFTLQYKHLNSGLSNLAYSVTATDSTDIRSLFDENIQRAVKLSTEFDLCTQSNMLQWTEYEGWEGNISGYKVFGGRDGAPLEELTFVPATTTSFSHSGLAMNSSYIYYVETFHTSGTTSLSALDTALSLYPEAPSYLTIDHVSVIDEASVEIQYSADIAGPVTSFRLLRRNNSSSPFLEVDTYWNVMESTQVVQDTVSTGSSTYQYLIESVFTPVGCASSIVISHSNTGNNILLVNELNDQIVTLSWTAYESYVPGLASYTIQRKDGNGIFVDVGSTGPLTTQWQESITPPVNGFQPGEFQYRIIAVSNPHNGGTEEQSISNITSAVVETHTQIPSAFTPNSNDINSQFKPLFDFSPRDYLMIVVDRGGRKMFETTDPNEGWDGRFQGGSLVDEAVYVYYIQYTDYTGLFRTHTGNITVLYP